jgi:integrase
MSLAEHVGDPDPKYAGLKTNARYRAMIITGGWLGPRWNEILGVRRGDLNPLHGEIAFGRVVINQNGNQLYEKRGSKTDDHRIVPVPAMVLDELERHIATYCPDAGPRDYIFLNSTGGHPLRSNFRRDALGKAIIRAGLTGRRITWLTLRHTAASLMFDAGLTIFDVQRRLGHHSPVLTQEIYTHLMRERYDEGRKTMEDYIRNVMDR